jgi:CubicO group peptidase (beta-lactamase class C family)
LSFNETSKVIWMKTAALLAALTVPASLAVAPPGRASDGPADKVKRIDELLTFCHSEGQFNGSVLVAGKGTVLYRKAFGKANFEWHVANTPDTKFRIASISKVFLVVVILQLAEEGKVELDRSVNHCLPGFSRKWGDRVTLRQLLTYTSGLPDYNDIPDFFRLAQSGLMTDAEFLKRIADHDLLAEPGTKFGYSSDGINVLGKVIEKVAGKPYEQVLRERVLDPAGLKDTSYANQEVLLDRRAAGYRKTLAGLANAPFYHPEPASGLYSTVDDLFRFNQALSADKMLSPRQKELIWSVSPKGNAYGWLNYCLTLTEPKEELLVLMTDGAVYGFYSRLLRLPRDDFFIVLLTNVRSSHNTLPEISDAIVRILYGRPFALPKRSIAEALRDTVERQGVQAALREYRDLKARQSERYEFGEAELNSLGYFLLLDKRHADDAIAVFRLNAEEYPRAWNVYDSLGEVYMEVGDREKAIASYKKSLELNPANGNAAAMLKRLEARPTKVP